MSLPEGFAAFGRGGASAFADAELLDWVEEAMSAHSLYAAALARAENVLEGRGPVPIVTVAGRRRVVRHYHRGGAAARVLGDRHLRLGRPRPVLELHASERARRGGIATPRVVAGAWYAAGAFYRADLVTDYVPDSTDLAAVLFGGSDPDRRRDALHATGSLIARMAAIGLRHPDLNARNVLLTEAGSRLEAVLVDLDRARAPETPRPISAGPMLDRLLRSLAKIGRSRPGGPNAAELDALRHAVGGGGAAG